MLSPFYQLHSVYRVTELYFLCTEMKTNVKNKYSINFKKLSMGSYSQLLVYVALLREKAPVNKWSDYRFTIIGVRRPTQM